MMRYPLAISLSLALAAAAAQTDSFYLLKPLQVFDGENMNSNWVVLVQGNKIVEAGPMTFKLPANTRLLEYPNATLMPGMIEGHSHFFLHPYNETPWNDQVLKESRSERTIRAVNHARATLMAGFTTVRDLGTEGAHYDDVGLKTSIQKGLVPGPRMIIATRAIVAKQSYGPNFNNPDIDLPQGAEEVADAGELASAVRTQMGRGADVIKIYADYRYGTQGEARPTFTASEWQLIMSLAKNGGRKVVAHASTPEGMKLAAESGVSTIEHGDGGTIETFNMMKKHGVALCPTLSAVEATAQYNGWRRGIDPEPARVSAKKQSFRDALKSGVTICMGGDVGVFTHGDNAREMELMVEYGMKPIDVLRSATSINADVFGFGDRIGRIKKGLLADIVIVDGDPSDNIGRVRNVNMVMKDGKIVKQ